MYVKLDFFMAGIGLASVIQLVLGAYAVAFGLSFISIGYFLVDDARKPKPSDPG